MIAVLAKGSTYCLVMVSNYDYKNNNCPHFIRSTFRLSDIPQYNKPGATKAWIHKNCKPYENLIDSYDDLLRYEEMFCGKDNGLFVWVTSKDIDPLNLPLYNSEQQEVTIEFTL